jgi:branched-chain amino acid transport system permease protein
VSDAPIAKWRGLDARALVLPAGLVLLIVLPLAGDIFLVRFVSRILIYALVALSLDLILGYGGMVSFGHAMFFGVGMYVTGVLYHHGVHSAFIAWPAAVLVSAAVAAVVGALSLRTGGFYFIMVTLAFSQMLYYLGVALVPYGGDEGMAIAGRNTVGGLIDLNNHTTFYYVVLAVLLLALYFCKRLIESSFGLAIVGIRSNERRMRALGFPTFRYKLACFVIAAALAGLAGALIANQSKYFSPSTMHWFVSGELMIMVILGGMGTRYGAVIGAIVFIVLEDILKGYTEHWLAIFGPILLLIVLIGANGIYGYLPRGKPLFGAKRAAPEVAK